MRLTGIAEPSFRSVTVTFCVDATLDIPVGKLELKLKLASYPAIQAPIDLIMQGVRTSSSLAEEQDVIAAILLAPT